MGQGHAAEFDSAADTRFVFRCDSGLRVGVVLEVRVGSAERKARQLFGAGSAEVLRGRGADRSWGSSFLLPSAGLAGSSGLEASRSFGVEGLKASRVVESDAQSELRRSIFVAVAFGWRWWRPDGGCARLTLASSLLRQGSSDPRLRGRLLVQPKWIEVETTRLDLGFGNGTEDEATATRAEPSRTLSGERRGPIRAAGSATREPSSFFVGLRVHGRRGWLSRPSRRAGALRGARRKVREWREWGALGERLVGSVTSTGRPSGSSGEWPAPSRPLAEAALDG
jgi:hypothetical protein